MTSGVSITQNVQSQATGVLDTVSITQNVQSQATGVLDTVSITQNVQSQATGVLDTDARDSKALWEGQGLGDKKCVL